MIATEGEARAAKVSGIAATAAARAFPCLNSHNCTDQELSPQLGTASRIIVPPSARRTAYALTVNVASLVERYGIERIGFLTLTFADHVLLPKEAQRRYHSLRTHVLALRFPACIRVFERQKSGRIHYHLLVAMTADIRTGCDFEQFAQGDYRSAGRDLRAEWAFWRSTAKEFGFGRTEILPIRSSAEAVSRYVGKYIAKHIEVREKSDKGVRLVEYSRGARIANTRFAWVSPGAKQWRAKLGGFIHMMHSCGKLPVPTEAAMRTVFGKKWAYLWRDNIAAFPVDWVDQ